MSSIDRIRSQCGRLVSRVLPGLDEWVFNRDRDRVLRDAVGSAGYEEALRGVMSQSPGRPTRLVVVPQVGPDHPSFRVAGGNFFFEIAQAAREVYGDVVVDVFAVDGSESSAEWHQRLIRHLVETGATHVIAQIEADPNCEMQRYSWDVFWSQLHPRWDGVFLGLTTDSYFTWNRASARRLARMCDRFVLVDICKPMDGVLVPGRPEVGPVNMPVSNASFSEIDAACADVERVFDVSFIGTLYPYRAELLERIRGAGAHVAVNPHRDDRETSAPQPAYVDYMKALAASRITINFSQENAGTEQQLKTRILEAAGMGCLVLTDDVDRTELFWAPEDEYGFFATADDLPGVVAQWLADPERLERVRLAGQRKARAINVSSFWGGIDEVLGRRGLRTLES